MIHTRQYFDRGRAVVLNCQRQVEFMLLDDANFSALRSGHGFRYYGGQTRYVRTTIRVPNSGNWNVVVRSIDGSGFRYGLTVI